MNTSKVTIIVYISLFKVNIKELPELIFLNDSGLFSFHPPHAICFSIRNFYSKYISIVDISIPKQFLYGCSSEIGYTHALYGIRIRGYQRNGYF